MPPEAVHERLTDGCGYRVHLLKDWLQGGPALDAAGFAASMNYPFQAFDYAVMPAESVAQRNEHPAPSEGSRR